MIFFNETDSDVLGSMELDGERYQLRVSEGSEPDVYHWHTKNNARKGWVKLNGYQNTKKLELVRNEWYRAGGKRNKAAK